ncbi:hypothetical protein EJB05_27414, partial [Eragrostis curvula]
MELYSGARMMSLRCLCHLVLRAWPKIFAFAPSLLKTLQSDHEHVDPSSPMEEATVNRESLELPVDILTEIFALLQSLTWCARAVCAPRGTLHSPAYAALGGIHGSRRRASSTRPNLPVTTLAENRVYKLTLPEPPIRSRNLIVSSNGWLVTADERSELHIINPITGQQIALPSVTTIEQVKPLFDYAGAVQDYKLSQYIGEYVLGYPDIFPLDKLRDKLYEKAFLFSDSSTRSFIVVLIHNPICKEIPNGHGCRQAQTIIYDCIYVDVTSTGRIDAFDLAGPVFLRKVIINGTKFYNYEHMYLVQAPTGDLLQVWREQDVIPVGDVDDEDAVRDLSELIRGTRKMMLYKVDVATKELVQINSLHGHVLFLGHNQSSFLSAEKYPQLKANHVYLTDNEGGLALWKSNRRDIGIFNLENNTIEEITPSQFWCTWPAPILVQNSSNESRTGFRPDSLVFGKTGHPGDIRF